MQDVVRKVMMRLWAHVVQPREPKKARGWDGEEVWTKNVRES